MRKQILIIFILTLLMPSASIAQTSRRAIEKYSTESIKQLTMSGRTPTVDILDSLANNAEVSIEMISRMDDPEDARQSRACLKLIDAIVDYSLTATGRRYVDVVRSGLKKALDRSYESDVQLHVMEQLARCAKPADATHIAMYLEVPELAPTAQRILVGMTGIDDRIAEAAAAQPGIKSKVQGILDIHAGKKPAGQMAVVTAKPKPAAIPFWTESLDKAVAEMASHHTADADNIIINNNPGKAATLLMQLARQEPQDRREATIARCLTLLEHSSATGEERYLLLRRADELTADNNLRRRIIISLGETGTIQALSYLRKYYGNATLADALAVAATDIIAIHPEANGGRAVSGMLYAAKQSYIRHYDEQGVDSRIDQVLAAIDNWRADTGYNFSHTEQTHMEKRGFWIIHDEMTDFDLAFDWRATGPLTISLRSMPVLTLDCRQGAKLAGSDSEWHKFKCDDEWSTANVSVKGDRVTVVVNGQKVIDGAKLANNEPGEPANRSGFVKFLADDNGATIREYCFKK